MDVRTQTIEQYLFEQLEKIAPGKYTLANVLQLFKSRLRFPCCHLKGGRAAFRARVGKDYNFSIFTYVSGVTEIKCLYNCGLVVRSDDKDMTRAFKELLDLPTTNTRAQSEHGGTAFKLDPGPAPTYTDEHRKRIRESGEIFLKSLAEMVKSGRIKPGDPILGGVFPHPDSVEAPDTIVERGVKQRHVRNRIKKIAKTVIENATVTFQDKIPEPMAGPEPVKKIRKRKTQSRRKRSGK